MAVALSLSNPGYTRRAPQHVIYSESHIRQQAESDGGQATGKPQAPQSVSRDHNRLGGFLIALLQAFARENSLGEVFYYPFPMKLGDRFAASAPDIMFVGRERLSHVHPDALHGPADFVIEIASPQSRSHDRGEKFYEYEAGGVSEYCLIDPERQSVEYYRRDGRSGFQSILPDADGRIYSEILPHFHINVAWLWQTPFPTLRTVLSEWGSRSHT